jgi:phosphotransferase system enzyme I (PtsI)
MTGRTVTIRTLDLGADKADRTGLTLDYEPNPAMGLRGVRLSLARAGLLETQLRAMLRASGYGPLRILLPMISSREEVRTVRAEMMRIARDLRSEGYEIADYVALGAMIEVPAAAISLSTFIGGVDFLSIGTNDLIQYLLAADRNNEALGDLYTALHPAVLRLLRDVIRLAAARNTPIAVCGELAGDSKFAPLLLALGLEQFSLHPTSLLEVRRTIRNCDLDRLRANAPALMRARDRSEIERWLAAQHRH